MPKISTLHVNGRAMTVDADEERSLLSVLRDDLDLTGAKYGCGEGKCGACTVLIDGLATRSCITKIGKVGEKNVTTIESLAQGERLHPLQQAFLDAGAMQCAYCTCGMIMSAFALLKQKPNPSREEVVDGMDGNVCRCGTYGRITQAVLNAAKMMKEVK